MLPWSSVFRGEGSGNEDTFLNSGCCAGARFQAGKVPPHSPATSRPVRSGTHCFSGHPVFHGTARQTAEKSNVFFLGCLGSDSFGTSLLASSAVSGVPLLRARSGPGPNLADDRLAERDELASVERVHDQFFCDGSSGAPLMRAGGTDDSSGAPMLESFSSGFDAGMDGELPAAACVSGYVREDSALQVSSSARGREADCARLCGAGVSRLRHQARSRFFEFVGLSDAVSSSRLGHLLHSRSLGCGRVNHMNSCFGTHDVRTNSWVLCTLHTLIQGSC